MIRGVTLRILCRNKILILKRPIQRIIPFEIVESEVDERKIQNVNGCAAPDKLKPSCVSMRGRPKSTAAVVGDMRSKLAENKNI